MKKVNILGVDYEIRFSKEQDDPRLKECDGYFDSTTQLIVVVDPDYDVMNKHDIEAYKRKVLRHEINHAFLYESGLDMRELSEETVVDWLAIQFSKIAKAYQIAGCLD